MANSEQANGTTTREQEWVIARDEGLWLIGRLALFHDGALGNEHQVLSPVFELSVNVQHQSGGALVSDHVQPLLLMGFMATKWKLSPRANTWPVKSAGAREKSLRAGIQRGEEMMRVMRAQDTGSKLHFSTNRNHIYPDLCNFGRTSKERLQPSIS